MWIIASVAPGFESETRGNASPLGTEMLRAPQSRVTGGFAARQSRPPAAVKESGDPTKGLAVCSVPGGTSDRADNVSRVSVILIQS